MQISQKQAAVFFLLTHKFCKTFFKPALIQFKLTFIFFCILYRETYLRHA